MAPIHRLLVLCHLLLCLALIAGPLSGADGLSLAPGQEGPLVMPSGTVCCAVYLPTDYVPTVPTPLIFVLPDAYRGGTWPFQEATGGAGYIVCGLSYAPFIDQAVNGLPADPAKAKAMMDFIAEVRAMLSRAYDIDQHQVTLAGFGLGGFAINHYGFQTSQKGLYDGYAILGAAASEADTDLSVAAGLPVLVLNGDRCESRDQATNEMPALDQAGAVLTRVVLKGQPHEPSTQSLIPPLKAWLATVKAQADRLESMAAVAWHAGTITGQPGKTGDLKGIVASFLARQPGLSLIEGVPTLLYFTDAPVQVPAGAPAGIARHAADCAAADAALFTWPDATAVPVAAHDFNAIRIDVGGIDPRDDRVFNRDTAPMVVLLDRDFTCAAVLKGRSQLTENAVMAAMRPFLTADQRGAVDAALAAATPMATTMQGLQRRIAEANARLLHARNHFGNDPAVIKQEQQWVDELAALDPQYLALRDQVAAASVPATAGAVANVSATAGALANTSPATASAPVTP